MNEMVEKERNGRTGMHKSIIKTKPYTYTASGCSITCSATDLILPSATKITACCCYLHQTGNHLFTKLSRSNRTQSLSDQQLDSRASAAGGAGRGRGGRDHYTQHTTHTTDYTPDC